MLIEFVDIKPMKKEDKKLDKIYYNEPGMIYTIREYIGIRPVEYVGSASLNFTPYDYYITDITP